MNNQTIKNGPADRSDEAKIELEKRLRSIWLEILNLFQTFAELDEVKDKSAEAKSIRELFMR